MPVVRTIIPPRKSLRLRHAGPKSYDDDQWETYDETLLDAKSKSACAVKPNPDDSYTPSHLFDAFALPSAECESGHIPRPRNAFICFRSDYVKAEKRVSARPGSIDQTVMSCGAATAWRLMDDDERRPYIRQAQAEKEAHALKYPNYRYSPGSGGSSARKNRKAKATAPRRASTAGSDASEASPQASVSSQGSSGKHETRRAPRKKSTHVTPRPHRKSSASVQSVVEVVPEPVLVDASEPTPELILVDASESTAEPTPTPPTPTSIPIDLDAEVDAGADCRNQKEAGSQIKPTSVRPSSWDRSPTQFGFAFKKGIAATVIESLSLATPAPTPSLPPSPRSSMDMQALSLSVSTVEDSYRLRSPSPSPVPAPAPKPWDSSLFAPLEMHDDTLDFEVQFASPEQDFGFFYPWDLDAPSSTTTRTLADDVFEF